MSIIEIAIYGMAFVGGIALIPMLAWGIGSALPAFVAEPLANGLLTVSFMGTGPAEIRQLETDEYVIRPAEDDLGPKSYWEKLAMSKVGITFESTKEAFGTLVEDIDTDSMVVEDRFPMKAASADLDRGGFDWYIPLREDGLFIPLGEKLAELRDSAGLEIGAESIAEALKEYGGDTSAYSPKVMVGGMILFAIMGLVSGYVVAY